MTGLGGAAALRVVGEAILIVSVTCGVSAGVGSIAGVIANSKEKHLTKKKIIFNNFLGTFVAILLTGIVSEFLTGLKIIGFLIIFGIPSILAIISGQLAGYLGMLLYKSQIIDKYKHLIIGICLVVVGIFVCIVIFLITESLFFGLFYGVIAGWIVILIYRFLDNLPTKILIYSVTGLLGISMYFIIGFGILFMVTILHRVGVI